jgi:hypothetical protein
VALNLTKKGYWIVPCDGKKPVGTDWQGRRREMAELWRELHIPGKNIALVLNRSNLIDVECDTEEAEARLHEMFGGAIPMTPTWQSKRGRHRLFVRPEGLPEKAVEKLDGVEFRGLGTEKGAVSVIPPSVHPDGPKYQWLPGLSLGQVRPAALPADLIERLRSSEPTAPCGKGGLKEITEGSRNKVLFKYACNLIKSKLPKDMISPIVHAMNESLCRPPLDPAEVDGILRSARSQNPQSSQKTNGDVLLEIAKKDSVFWHTPEKVGYATILHNGHREHWPLRSKGYRQWLAKEFYDREGSAVGTQTLNDAITTIEGKAIYDGEEHEVFVRVASHGGCVYLDMCDEQWRVIRIDENGWEIVTDCPVLFRRSRRMLPLPEPERGGTINKLRDFLNVTKEDWPLVLAFVFDCLRPEGPRTILKIAGEQGSAKTTATKVIRGLIDPNTCESRGSPHSERDLRIAAESSWLCAFDNLSYVTPELSDALCRLSSGGGFGVRSHYENDEETVFKGKRPIILNGIEEVGTRSDLSDRSLLIQLPRLEDDKRKSESVFDSEFAAARPAILGAFLDAVAVALWNLPSVREMPPEGGWPRMMDFAQWVVAGETALGLKSGQFLEAYRANRESQDEAALESCPVAKAVIELMKGRRKWEGTATQLLGYIAIGQDTRVKGWPKNARALSGMLGRLAPSLRRAGLVIEQDKKENRKLWRIENPNTAKATIPASKPKASANPQSSQNPQDKASRLRTNPQEGGGLAEELRKIKLRIAPPKT